MRGGRRRGIGGIWLEIQGRGVGACGKLYMDDIVGEKLCFAIDEGGG